MNMYIHICSRCTSRRGLAGWDTPYPSIKNAHTCLIY